MLWTAGCLLLSGLQLGDSAAQLPMVDPVQVGHVRKVRLTGAKRAEEPSREVEMRTLAMNPPIFHISGLLDDAEADAIIQAANASGAMGASRVSHPNEDIAGRSLRASSKAFRQLFRAVDENRDMALNAEELQRLLTIEFDVPNNDFDAFLARYNFSSPSITLAELRTKGVDFGEYVQWLVREQPHRRSRYSVQTWLAYELPATRALRSRVKTLTQLPRAIVQDAEALQVLRYPRLGHYSCHHDSAPDGLEAGQSVRLATVAFFLNEAEGGGEIAFPGADHPHLQAYGEEEWSDLESMCQPTPACTQMGGVVVKPKKGDAVWWYNMKANLWANDGRGKSPGPEALYWNSMHCGAEVTAGEKWMANLWLRSPHHGRKRARSERNEL